jgi:hypothetical protein
MNGVGRWVDALGHFSSSAVGNEKKWEMRPCVGSVHGRVWGDASFFDGPFLCL